jgi:hypothetical protein
MVERLMRDALAFFGFGASPVACSMAWLTTLGAC